MGGNRTALPKEQYDALLAGRQQLMMAALGAVRALMDYDASVTSRFFAMPDAPRTGGADLAAAVRAAAPLVTCKSDWAALYMLFKERGLIKGYTDLVRLVGQYAPEAVQPNRQGLNDAVWDTRRRRFPDWQPEGISYDKFRRHFMIAQAAAAHL